MFLLGNKTMGGGLQILKKSTVLRALALLYVLLASLALQIVLGTWTPITSSGKLFTSLIESNSTAPTDGLMVLAFFFEMIVIGGQTFNLSGHSQPYKDEGKIMLDGKNLTMFEAIRHGRHIVNPNLDAQGSVWSHMEWDNLLHYNIIKNLSFVGSNFLPEIQTPLEYSEGGLGWYDNLRFDVRQRQGELAREHGVDGFIYYTDAGRRLTATRALIEARVRDGHPSGPFALMVVDESRGIGTNKLVAFAEWLAQVVEHRDYIRVEGKPVVYLYKLTALLADGDNVTSAKSVRRALQIMEEAAGRNIHWIGTYTGYCLKGVNQEHIDGLYKELDAWIDFAPHRGNCMTTQPVGVSPEINTFYETFLSGWNPAPRGLAWFESKHKWDWKSYMQPQECSPKNSPARFFVTMMAGFVRARCRQERTGGVLDGGGVWKPVSVFAWNEWGEQALLEPSRLEGFSYLISLQRARHEAAKISCSSIPEELLRLPTVKLNIRKGCEVTENFDASFYKSFYRDLSNLSDEDARLHFEKNGRTEGRKGCKVCCPGCPGPNP